MNMIRTVFYDIGWTLVRPASGDWTFTKRFFEVFPAVSPDDLKTRKFRDALSEAFRPLRENPGMKDIAEQKERYTVFYKTFCSLYNLPCDDHTAADLAQDISCNDRNMLALDTVYETLNALKRAGIRLQLISDTWPNIETQMDALHLTDYFDHCTYSYRLGTNKPSPMMYADALEHCGCSPRECLFIDDIPANLEGAEKFGIRGIQSLADPDRKSDPRFPGIARPYDLIRLLQEE